MWIVVAELSITNLELDSVQVQFSWQVIPKHMMLTTSYCEAHTCLAVLFLVFLSLISGFKRCQHHSFIIVSPSAFHLIVSASFADHRLYAYEEKKFIVKNNPFLFYESISQLA